MTKKTKRFHRITMALLAILTTSATTFGAGFAIVEQSVKGQGEAFSGGSTASDDASCIYFNPAAMPLTGNFRKLSCLLDKTRC